MVDRLSNEANVTDNDGNEPLKRFQKLYRRLSDPLTMSQQRQFNDLQRRILKELK